MARGRKTITQRIALDGGKEIQEELSKLGREGEKAFEQLKKAVEQADEPGKKFSRTVEQLQRNVRRLGEAGQRVGRDLQNIGRSMGEVGVAARGVALRITGVAVAAGAAGVALVRFAQAGTRAADEAGKTAAALGLSIGEFDQYRFALAQSGVSSERMSQGFARLNAEIVKTAEEARKTGQSVTQNVSRGLEQGLESGFGGAVQKFDDIGVTVFRGFRQGADETSAALTDISRQAAEPTTALGKLGIRVTGANGELRSFNDILGDMADKFQSMPDGIEKTNAAVLIFGQRIGPLFIPFLNEGRQGIERLTSALDATGLAFTEVQQRIATEMNDSMAFTGLVARRIRENMGIAFAPAITEASERFRESLLANNAALQEFAETGGTLVVPVVEDLINAFQGNDLAVGTSGIIEFRDAVIGIGNALKSVNDNVLMPFFRAVGRAADRLASVINQVLRPLGAEITGTELLITAALVKLLRIVSLVTAAFGLLAAAIGGWPALLVLAVVGVALFADEVGAILSRLTQGFTDFATDVTDTIRDLFSGLVSFIDDAISGLLRTIERIISAIGRAASAARRLFSGSGGSSSESSGGETPAFARGGRVRGPGTGTSDSILARLSDGEFVIRAAAVKKFGVGFLDAINRLRWPGGFAQGGKVSLPKQYKAGVPAFSLGGMVDGFNRSMMAPAMSTPSVDVPQQRGGRAVYLNIDNQRFEMVASDDVAQKIIRYATGRNVRRAGIKPGWAAA